MSRQGPWFSEWVCSCKQWVATKNALSDSIHLRFVLPSAPSSSCRPFSHTGHMALTLLSCKSVSEKSKLLPPCCVHIESQLVSVLPSPFVGLRLPALDKCFLGCQINLFLCTELACMVGLGSEVSCPPYWFLILSVWPDW
jgi:hypothetical protein